MFDHLLSEKERRIRDAVRSFVIEKVSPQLVRDLDADAIRYPKDYVRQLASARLLGLRFDPRYGGGGADWATEVCALEEIGTLGATLGCLYSLVSIVGEAVHAFGTEEQKEKYLAPTLRGEKFCAEALTEPRGGSDFFGATTRAEKQGDEYVLTGQKRFVVGGEAADYFLVYARTAFGEGRAQDQISAFLVDRDDSIKVEYHFGLMGARGGGAARISFVGTRVPARNLILGENRGAEVFNRMMIPERMTSAAAAIGAARAALEIATRYSTRRKAFGKKIMKFQAVSFHIAEAVSSLDAARSLVWVAARKVDAGQDARRLVSEAKKVATEAAWDVVNRSMQVMGGIGYTDVFPIERLLRDVRLMMIWTGTNEIMNLLVQHEWYSEHRERPTAGRDIELDTQGFEHQEEKVFED